MWGTGFWFDEGAWASGAWCYAMESPPALYVSWEGGSGHRPRRLRWAPREGPGGCSIGVWLRRTRSVARLGVLHHCRPPHFVDTGHKAAAFSIISWRSFVVDCHSPAETLVCSFGEHPLATSRAPLPEFRRALLTLGAGRWLEGRMWVVQDQVGGVWGARHGRR